MITFPNAALAASAISSLSCLELESAWIIPPKYTSETVILVEPQKVPQQFVMPNVQVDLEERLQSITQQVLSRIKTVVYH